MADAAPPPAAPADHPMTTDPDQPAQRPAPEQQAQQPAPSPAAAAVPPEAPPAAAQPQQQQPAPAPATGHEPSPSVGGPAPASAPRATIATPIPPSQLPVRQYLEATVVPILMQGMQQMVKVRPEDPVAWLANFLNCHNPRKRPRAE